MLLGRIENEIRHDTALMVQKIEDQAKEEAKQKSTNIMLQAMQRYAAEVTSEGTTKSVEIPSDDMKGRIIGREGRNIRAFEQATGVDVIIDDTPGVITVNCFDPVRREVAKITMEKLIADGRIHPARIEEIVDATQKEIENNIRQMGKKAVLECNIQGVHPKIVEMLGRLHYRTSYGQNVLRHSVEVAFLSQMIADELRLDGALARRAGLLHDIGKSMDHDQEGGHPAIGMEFVPQVQRTRSGAQRDRRPPQRHSGDDAVHADHHGRGCDLRRPPRGAARDAGALHQAAAGSGSDRHEFSGRQAGVCDPGRPRGARDRRSGAVRRCDGEADRPRHRQADPGGNDVSRRNPRDGAPRGACRRFRPVICVNYSGRSPSTPKPRMEIRGLGATNAEFLVCNTGRERIAMPRFFHSEPAFVARDPAQFRPRRVAFHIPADPPHMPVSLDGKRLEAALVQLAGAGGMMVGVPALGVGEGQPAHEIGKQFFLPAPRPEHEVEMIGHQHIRENPQREMPVRFGERALKGGVVGVVDEDRRPRGGPVDHMINHPALNVRRFSGHAGILTADRGSRKEWCWKWVTVYRPAAHRGEFGARRLV